MAERAGMVFWISLYISLDFQLSFRLCDLFHATFHQHLPSHDDVVEYKAAPTVAAIAAAVRELIKVDDITAVAAFTVSGATARVLAKSRLSRPILALSPDIAAVRRMCLYYGVESVQAKTPKHTREVLSMASRFVRDMGMASSGDKILVVSGRPLGQSGSANTIVVHTVS